MSDVASERHASVLASEKGLAEFYDAAAKGANDAKTAANLVINDLLSALSAAEKSIAEVPFPAGHLSDLVNIIHGGSISSKQGKEVFTEMFATGKAPAAIVEEKGMKQESDAGALEVLCKQAIEASAKAVAEYKAGKLGAINAIKGQVMKLSGGKANPAIVNDLLQKLLS